jgi:tRNA(Ile)-lysidine synthase
MRTFEENVLQFVADENLIPTGSRILLAISGGADSMAMLNALYQLKKTGLLPYELFVAHINHQLRGAMSDKDEALVLTLAIALRLPCETVRVDVKTFAAQNRLSIENAARSLRRDALITIAGKFNCSLIATAHHNDDNAETVIHRLLRGTAYRGLGGIWPKKVFHNKTFIRPLLNVSRSQILQYVQSQNILFNHDHTNDDTAITRNFIRHKLLPEMQRNCPSDIPEMLSLLSSRSRRLVELLESKLHTIWPGVAIVKLPRTIILDRAVFNTLPMPIRVEVVRRAVTKLGIGEKDYTFSHYQKVVELSASQKSDSLNLPGQITLSVAQTTLTFDIPSAQNDIWPAPTVIAPGQAINWNGFTIAARVLNAVDQDISFFIKNKPPATEWFDLDKIVGSLTIRARANGDRFWPLGLGSPKKVGKFLSDAHATGKQTFVIEDDQKIIYLAPIRPCEQTKLTASTSRILEVIIGIRSQT